MGATNLQHHPPCPVPCTKTKVVVIAPAIILLREYPLQNISILR